MLLLDLILCSKFIHFQNLIELKKCIFLIGGKGSKERVNISWSLRFFCIHFLLIPVFALYYSPPKDGIMEIISINI